MLQPQSASSHNTATDHPSTTVSATANRVRLASAAIVSGWRGEKAGIRMLLNRGPHGLDSMLPSPCRAAVPPSCWHTSITTCALAQRVSAPSQAQTAPWLKPVTLPADQPGSMTTTLMVGISHCPVVTWLTWPAVVRQLPAVASGTEHGRHAVATPLV